MGEKNPRSSRWDAARISLLTWPAPTPEIFHGRKQAFPGLCFSHPTRRGPGGPQLPSHPGWGSHAGEGGGGHPEEPLPNPAPGVSTRLHPRLTRREGGRRHHPSTEPRTPWAPKPWRPGGILGPVGPGAVGGASPDNCRARHRECPWKPQGKGVPSFLQTLERTHSHVQACWRVRQLLVRGFSTVARKRISFKSKTTPRVYLLPHFPPPGAVRQARRDPTVPAERPLPPRATGWRCRRALRAGRTFLRARAEWNTGLGGAEAARVADASARAPPCG